MLSNTSKYAIRAVIYLALNTQKTQKIGIKKISADLEIPTPFLGKILQLLAKHKILTSTKGPNGGFGIEYNISKLSMLDIVEIIDGDDMFTTCLLSNRSCETEEKHCAIHKNFSPIKEQLKDMFQKKTIKDLVDHARKNKDEIIL